MRSRLETAIGMLCHKESVRVLQTASNTDIQTQYAHILTLKAMNQQIIDNEEKVVKI